MSHLYVIQTPNDCHNHKKKLFEIIILDFTKLLVSDKNKKSNKNKRLSPKRDSLTMHLHRYCGSYSNIQVSASISPENTKKRSCLPDTGFWNVTDASAIAAEFTDT